MKLSHRITHLTETETGGWELFIEARRRMAAGEDILELTIGEHDTRTDPSILNAMHADALAGNTGYASVPGITALREEVARRVTSRTGVPTSPANVLIPPGGQAALFASHVAVLDPGDRALYIDPYYATYPGTLRGAGAVAVAVAARSRDGFQPDPAAIDAAASGARSLLINSPNNPTGVVYSKRTLEGIAEVALARDLWLISDEVYDTQVWDGTHLSPRTLPDMMERTLVVGSMSKSHAMTGSRIGWIVGPEDAVAAMTNLATHTTYGVPGFLQAAALFALRQGSAFEERIAAPFHRRRDIAARVLDGSDVIRLIPPSGAMYVMLDIRATGLSGDEFAFGLLEAERIAVMPGESFGDAAAGHLRVALTVDDARLEEALRRLRAYAEAVAQKEAAHG